MAGSNPGYGRFSFIPMGQKGQKGQFFKVFRGECRTSFQQADLFDAALVDKKIETGGTETDESDDGPIMQMALLPDDHTREESLKTKNTPAVQHSSALKQKICKRPYIVDW